MEGMRSVHDLGRRLIICAEVQIWAGSEALAAIHKALGSILPLFFFFFLFVLFLKSVGGGSCELL